MTVILPLYMTFTGDYHLTRHYGDGDQIVTSQKVPIEERTYMHKRSSLTLNSDLYSLGEICTWQCHWMKISLNASMILQRSAMTLIFNPYTWLKVTTLLLFVTIYWVKYEPEENKYCKQITVMTFFDLILDSRSLHIFCEWALHEYNMS